MGGLDTEIMTLLHSWEVDTDIMTLLHSWGTAWGGGGGVDRNHDTASQLGDSLGGGGGGGGRQKS